MTSTTKNPRTPTTTASARSFMPVSAPLILDQIKRAAPAGQPVESQAARRRLDRLTGDLLAASPDAIAEYARYLRIAERGIETPWTAVSERIAGRRVVVTGATGCIGTALLDQLRPFGPGGLVGVGITPPLRRVPSVQYRRIDVRDAVAVRELLTSERPDVVFHLAAQRDPGLAEDQVRETVSVNVLGTDTLARACEATGVAHLVLASTGKAMRPYSPDVYASSKRMGEWAISATAGRGVLPCAGARFTHVVDNAIVLRRFRQWCAEADVLRLHSAEMMFYAQSAKESAQLLLVAATAPRDDVFRVHAIRDLDWPFTALHLALGVMDEHGRATPMQVTGQDPGYEQSPYPGLYDPARAGDVSPLLNSLEAWDREQAACAEVDVAPLVIGRIEDLERNIDLLRRTCTRGGELEARDALQAMAWASLDATLQHSSRSRLNRLVELTKPHRRDMCAEHRQIDDRVQHWSAAQAPRRAAAPLAAAA